jgi:hypothetical protein
MAECNGSGIRSPAAIPAVYIGPLEEYSKRRQVFQDLNLDVKSIMPVKTLEDCTGLRSGLFTVFTKDVNNPSDLQAQTGIFLAHQKAWLSLVETGGLILEADEKVATQDMPALKAQLQAFAHNEDECDLQLLGYCYFPGFCTHAYVISRHGARHLLDTTTPLCKGDQNREPVDIVFFHACTNGELKCCYVKGKNRDGYFGYGYFQQDRAGVRGVRDMNDTFSHFKLLSTVGESPDTTTTSKSIARQACQLLQPT